MSMLSGMIRCLLIIGAVLPGLSDQAYSAPVISLQGIDHLEFSNMIDIHLDPSGSSTFQDVSHPNFGGFTRNTVVYPSFGNFGGRVWLRFAVANTSDAPFNGIIMLDAAVLTATFHEIAASGRLVEAVGGRTAVSGAEVLPNRVPSFPISLAPQETKTYYLSIVSDLVYVVKISLNTDAAFFQKERVNHYIGGFYLGVMLIMIFYNSFLYFATREISFLWYVLTVFFLHIGVVGLATSNNDFFGYKWPLFPTHWAVYSKILGTVLFVQFSRSFLQTEKTPKLDLYFKINIALAPVFVALVSLIPAAQANGIQNLSLLSCIVACICYSGYLFGRGVRYARFYFIAWFPLLLAGLVSVLLNASGNAHLFPNMPILLSLAAIVEVLLLSMALGDKMNEIKEEKARIDREYQAKVMEMNRELDRKVKEQTRDIRTMLDNLKLGIFTVDRHLCLGPGYSQHLLEMLPREQVQTFNATTCLFSDSTVGADEKDQVETAIMSSIGSDELGFIGNSHLFIRQLRKHRNGQIMDLELDWSPIQNDDGSVEKLLVAMRDVTLLNQLKRENESRQKEMDMLSQYLSAPRADMNQLENQVAKADAELESLAHIMTKDETRNLLPALFREIHTIKAQARRLRLAPLADALHEVETCLQGWMNGTELPDPGKLTEKRQAISAALARYHNILAGLGISLASLSDSRVETDLETFLQELLSERISLAEELGKAVPDLKIHLVEDLELTPDLRTMLSNTLIHLLRNSLDHGFEAEDKRLELGKPRQGRIELTLGLVKDSYVLTYRDDGSGLDLQRILEKAKEKGLLNNPEDELTASRLANFILSPGFSTRSQVSTISGRGIGMDAVANYLKEQGGNIEIILEGNDTHRPQPALFRMQWPRKKSKDQRSAA